MRSTYITRHGYSTLCNELDYLLRVKRPELTRAVSEAAALGDRSENAEYIYGKKLLRETDRRIRFLQTRIPDLKVIDMTPENIQRVYFAACVELEDTQGNNTTLRIVGSDEINPEKHWISIDSPMAKALIGKQLDDEITVLLPNEKTATYIINKITYEH